MLNAAVLGPSTFLRRTMTTLLTYYTTPSTDPHGDIHTLESRGIRVRPAEVGNWDPSQSSSTFDPRIFYRILRTQLFGRRLLLASTVPSTQTLLNSTGGSSSPLPPLPVGLAFVSDEQTAGRGRGTNAWESPAGCLTVTFTCGETEGQRLPCFQHLVSLAVVWAVQEITHRSDVGVSIKWPNDIYGGSKKIGGVLCQSTYAAGSFCVLVGLGLNLSNPHPTTSLQDIIRPYNGENWTREVFLATFFNRFEEASGVYSRKGFAPFREEYLQRWLHSGQIVTLEDGTRVHISGVTEFGFLQGEDDQGKQVELHPDGNSLDMWQGLVRVK